MKFVKHSYFNLMKFLTALVCAAFLLCGCTDSSNSSKETEKGSAPLTEAITEESSEESANENEQEEEMPDSKEVIYDELFGLLEKTLGKKDFGDEAEALIISTFDSVYENYPEWAVNYRGMPSVKKFMLQQFIDPLTLIDQIEYVPEDTEKGQKYTEEGSAPGYTEIGADNSIKVFVLGAPLKDPTKNDIRHEQEIFFHELTHCIARSETDVAFDTEEYRGYDTELYYILTEGAASFFQRFSQKYSERIGGSWTVSNSDGSYEIDYNNIDCIGYLVDLNVYTKLVYLVGYDAMFDLLMNRISLDEIAKMIYERYGNEAGKEFLSACLNRGMLYNQSDGHKGDKVFLLSVNIEKMFLDFIYADIERAETPGELEKAEALYRSYISIGLPMVRNITDPLNDWYGTEVTSSVFDTDHIEALLQTKTRELS